MRCLRWTSTLLLLQTLCFGLGQEPWEKPFASWTDADAERVLSDSAWAKPVVFKLPRSSRSKAAQPWRTVRWESALPVQQALRKKGIVPSVLDRQAYYAVAVLGSPGASGKSYAEELDHLGRPKAWLKAPNGEVVASVDVKLLEEDQRTPVMVFLFPRTIDFGEPRVFRLPPGIILHARKVDFAAHIGSMEIHESFPLQNMFYLGKLEL